jgi:hypothetical protein
MGTNLKKSNSKTCSTTFFLLRNALRKLKYFAKPISFMTFEWYSAMQILFREKALFVLIF